MTPKKIGTQIRKIRQERNLSIAKASQKMGISPATLWKLECGVAKNIQRKTKKAIEIFVKNEFTQPLYSKPLARSSFVVPSVKLELHTLARNLGVLGQQIREIQDSILELGMTKIRS